MSEHVFDIKNNLKKYFPIFFELLDNNNIDWKKIEKVFTKKHEEYEKRQAKSQTPLQIEASFYNIISSALNQDKSAIRLLDFIQKLFEELTEILDSSEKKLIVDILFGFLTNMDMKYLNFLGELCVLNLLKKQAPYKLTATEEPLTPEDDNSTSIDFKFLDITASKKVLVEVVNIHLEDKNTSSEEAINNLLTQKIHNKLVSKGIRENPDFYLIPVLWGQYTHIKAIESFLKKNPLTFPNTVIPVCFMTFADTNGVMVHKFGRIDTIFDHTPI